MNWRHCDMVFLENWKCDYLNSSITRKIIFSSDSYDTLPSFINNFWRDNNINTSDYSLNIIDELILVIL